MIKGRKRYLVEYLRGAGESVLLRDVVRDGYERRLVDTAVKAGLVDVHSSYRRPEL